VSHLPHLLSFALVHEPGARDTATSCCLLLPAAFRDFTRIAASSPEMWRDISLATATRVLRELQQYAAELYVLNQALENNDAAEAWKRSSVWRVKCVAPDSTINYSLLIA